MFPYSKFNVGIKNYSLNLQCFYFSEIHYSLFYFMNWLIYSIYQPQLIDMSLIDLINIVTDIQLHNISE